MSTIYQYPNSIKNAAELLDQAKPGWHDVIILDQLDMESSEKCILGQLYVDYYTGRRKLFGDYCWFSSEDRIFGYNAPVEIWVEEINYRRIKEKALKSLPPLDDVVNKVYKEKLEGLTFPEALQAVYEGKTVSPDKGTLTIKMDEGTVCYCHSDDRFKNFMPLKNIDVGYFERSWKVIKTKIRLGDLDNKQKFEYNGRSYQYMKPSVNGTNTLDIIGVNNSPTCVVFPDLDIDVEIQ